MSKAPHHILLITCPDRPGIIATVTALLFRHNLNIVVMKEFVDPETNTFFARAEITGELKASSLVKELQKEFDHYSTLIQLKPVSNKNIVLFATKEFHCLSDLIIRHHFKALHANIKAVISNYDTLEAFTSKFDIPFHYISHENKSKEIFEQELIATAQQYKPDYLILAKFMRILSPDFVQQFENKIINIHHSFLPAFVGANPYKQAYERGVKIIGATAHIVNNMLDEGPIITQKIIPVNHEYSVKQMVEAGHEVEKSVLAEALRLVLEDRVFVSNNKTIIFT
ncbi:formyltetrahydrofolate deformylase [Ferruginibacter lapsinanis]|uniref:formyltetrahydrofolate deformylase n=1 Tax=Ferruginibacter lapsinanis TaxID=563172 RepID=UPI001E41715C|nr:formyltetrahydrofolate deformylase [Ferruginibacter lapsinanis]UEG49750.1 formyltetrahydrofolate deformylase [Ferruginibacter lapsinanis]